MTAIYARQSIDKKDSISIETQIELCRRFADGESRVYYDKGYSGKNTDRPQFQRLLDDIKRGEIEKLVVYKLDRISRSLHDFSDLMELFKQHEVEFASTVETFDTATPIGRAMLGIIMVFAELERENILLRVKDNYYARGEKGLYLGGPPIYGFDKHDTKLCGIKTSVLIPNNRIHTVEWLYNTYLSENRSLGELAAELNAQGIPSSYGTLWDSCKISRLLRSPTYVMADMEVFKYYKTRGCRISNPAEDFSGERGCFLYGKREANERKYADVTDHVLSLGLHDGVIPSQIWLDVQRRLDGNSQINKGKSGTHSWLTGLVKCAKCGYALRAMQGEYFYCTGKANHKTCEGLSGKPQISEIELSVETELMRSLKELAPLLPRQNRTVDPRTNKLKMRLEQVTQQSDNLIDRIAESGEKIAAALEKKLNALLTEQARLEDELAALTHKASNSYDDLLPLLLDFQSLPREMKRAIAGELIERVRVGEGVIDIMWRV